MFALLEDTVLETVQAAPPLRPAQGQRWWPVRTSNPPLPLRRWPVRPLPGPRTVVRYVDAPSAQPAPEAVPVVIADDQSSISRKLVIGAAVGLLVGLMLGKGK
jgi:hypothetical protein